MNIGELERLLPHWFGKPELQWIQWIYALWQIIRCNPLALFALSYLPFCLCQMFKKKIVVVVVDNPNYTDYCMEIYDREEFLRHNDHPVKDIEILRYLQGGCSIVKYCEHYYITHGHTLCYLAKCAEKHGDISENIIFVERILTLIGSWAVGRKISHTEAYEKVLTNRYHLRKAADEVVPSLFDYIDLSSKFWGILSTVPILLQARNYNRVSNFFSLLIILLDFRKDILFKIYDTIFMDIADYVKLNVFKKRRGFYEFFSIFSNRWRYMDTAKKHAYVAKKGDEIKIRSYCKMEAVDDLKVGNCEIHVGEPDDQNIFMEIVKGRVTYCSPMRSGDPYADATLNKPVYVP